MKGECAMSLDREFVSCVVKNLPEASDDVKERWVKNPASLKKALRAALCPPQQEPQFPVWKTVKIGTGLKSFDDFLREFRGQSIKVSDWATDMMQRPAFGVADQQQEVDLVVVSGADLGFTKAAPRSKIYRRAIKLGLQLCPAEVGPQLRLQYADQPMDEWLLIGMEPLRDSGGTLCVFGVGRDSDGLWLGSYYGRPDYMWDPDYRWVFVRPRK